jgi:hypothetical protein
MKRKDNVSVGYTDGFRYAPSERLLRQRMKLLILG